MCAMIVEKYPFDFLHRTKVDAEQKKYETDLPTMIFGILLFLPKY